MMFAALIEPLIELLIPPRPTERLVRALTIAQLQTLYREDGLPYHDPRVKALIWELKYFASPRAAGLGAALLYESVLEAAAEELGRSLLIPVPMHPARRAVRGHNQTEVLCERLVARLGGAAQYAPRALARTVDTPTQQGRERRERLRNVRGSMQAHGVEGRACIVIDDVATTGATLAEAKRALRAAGARAVHTLALARS